MAKKINLEEETKKDMIIRLAKSDPFVSIEEVANQADTTNRYVRTILSEAEISLMQLRKEAYQNLEKLYSKAVAEIDSLESQLARYETLIN
ncbi:hypothetical protein SAMN06265827_10594 [Orenia metallireducens]|uniref:Uncharacterized protein n=1 Tax=Orenia metallireducens TaxID=1413210 RepID=A0A285G6Y4_9FIRM|nr:hypothetical protein [Orenia metallireducens]SNY19289.1 hypothetical protein SAMN06265827_10594 [Orenia metallireducens]